MVPSCFTICRCLLIPTESIRSNDKSVLSVSLIAPHRYSKLMGDEPDLDPDINKDFFENNVLQLDPSLLTENGMKCFERFFKAVNCREGKLVAKRRAYMMDDLELIGLDYLWRVRG